MSYVCRKTFGWWVWVRWPERKRRASRPQPGAERSSRYGTSLDSPSFLRSIPIRPSHSFGNGESLSVVYVYISYTLLYVQAADTHTHTQMCATFYTHVRILPSAFDRHRRVVDLDPWLDFRDRCATIYMCVLTAGPVGDGVGVLWRPAGGQRGSIRKFISSASAAVLLHSFVQRDHYSDI